MKTPSVLFVLTLSVTLMLVAAESGNNPGYAADYKVALLVSKTGRANMDIKKLNINRGYAAESDHIKPSAQFNAEDYFNLGVTHDRAGRPDKAIEDYQQAIHARPDYAEAHYLLALSYVKSNDSLAAHDEYKALKKINPQMARDLYEQIIELASSESGNRYVMQVGAYQNIEYAHKMIDKLREQYLNAYIEKGTKFNLVRIRGIKTENEAALIMKDIHNKFKVNPFVIPVQ